MCKRGPKVPIRIPTIIGPPASPNFTGTLTPGTAKGIAPSANPKTIPTNTATKLGSFKLLTALPRTFSTFWIAAASPTTVSLSPSCKVSSGVASSCTPARYTRLIFIPYVFLSLNEPNFFPFSSGRVTTMRCDTSCLSMAFQSISSLFQSVFSCCPNNTVSASTSFSAVTTSKRSPSLIIFSEVGMLTLPSLHNRDITNLG